MGKNTYKPTMNKYISIIHRKFQVYLNKELEKIDINSSEFMYLTTLYRCNEVTLTELSTLISVDNAQSTRIIKKLYQRGLVSKIRSDSDKREFKIALSDKGRQMIPIIKEALISWNEIVNKNLSQEDIDKVTQILETVASNVIEAVSKEENEVI